MVRDPFADEDGPDLEAVLDALDDPTCRAIVRTLDHPMTAEEIADAADVPLSTTYRKLDMLTAASLLDERVDVRPKSQHASQYQVEFEAVVVRLAEDRDFRVAVSKRARRPDERLEDLWAEVRKET
jgi:DNA-binding transcriptional ArsR family regulator